MAESTELKQLKCKTCGEPLDLNTAKDGVIICGVCDSCFTLPKKEALPEVINFLKQGEHDLDTGKFDDAYAAYSKAAEIDKTEPEAYWGMALAEHKIQYLKDEVNSRLQPICHEINARDFEDNSNFLKALRYATETQCAEYERKGKEINYIKDEFYKLEQSGLDYDCFICVKVSDENGGRTVDYKTADDIYFELKGKGYKPFFSERELGGVTGADYEARILYALYSSECMLVVCFDEGYLRTKWVKNEYTRFLKLVNDEEKESDSIALVFNKKPIEKLPNRHGKIQGIAVNSLSAMERIVSFVDNHTPEAKLRREEEKRRREEEAKRKAEEEEAQRKKIAEQEERIRQQEERFRKLEEMFKAQQEARQAEEEKRREEMRKQEEERKAREIKAEEERKAAEAARLAEQKAAEEKAKKAAEEKAKDEAAAAQAQATAKHKASVAKSTPKPAPNPVPAKAAPAKPVPAAKAEQPANVTPAKPVASRKEDFVIENGVLIKYNGKSENVVIPDGVTGVGENAFEKLEFIKTVKIPYGVKSLGHHAFNNCISLTTVTMPDSLIGIDAHAFSGCGMLDDVNIPNSVKDIGGYAFWDCAVIASIYIPNSVASIGIGAFRGCSGLKNVTIPDCVKNIGVSAFVGCSSLTKVTLPKRFSDDLEKIFGKKILNSGKCRFDFTGEEKTNAFSVNTASVAAPKTSASEKLAPVQPVVSPNKDFVIENGVLTEYKGKATKVVIPDGVTGVGDKAFRCHYKLLNVTIPNSVTSIGNDAFAGCNGLTSITIPNGVKSIGGRAFSNCTKLTSITIPNSVTSIGSQALWGCNRLTSITIPNSVTSIGYSVFGYCKGLESITADKNNPKYKSENNCLLSKDGKTLIAGCKNSIIPDGVTSIDWEAFRGCSQLTSLIIPNGVKSIGSQAFSDCSKLTSIIIPDGVTSIGNGAFDCCYDLNKIIIPESVIKIGKKLFYGTEKNVWEKSKRPEWVYVPIENLTVYCRAKKQPAGWDKDWNLKEKGKLFNGRHKVVWGYSGD